MSPAAGGEPDRERSASSRGVRSLRWRARRLIVPAAIGLVSVAGAFLVFRLVRLNQVLTERLEQAQTLSTQLIRYDHWLRMQNEGLSQDDYYLVVNRVEGKFLLRKRDRTIREGSCATGMGERFFAGRLWDFSTPVGERVVESVEEDPRWVRPRWFWLEQGLPVPRKFIGISQRLTPEEALRAYHRLSPRQRLLVRSVPGYLGKYKIALGEGINIHYGDLEAGNASHGCIRVSHADLEILHRFLKPGSKVYIY